jgi:hypothetical protein
MRAADADTGMILAVRDEHRGETLGSSVAKVEVLANLGGGYLHVRQIESYFGRPGCLHGMGWRHNEAHPEAQGVEWKVQSRYCWPWTDATTRMVEEGEARGAEARRRHAVVENIVNLLGLGTVAMNGRAFFDYDETVELARRLGLEFTLGAAERAADDPKAGLELSQGSS